MRMPSLSEPHPPNHSHGQCDLKESSVPLEHVLLLAESKSVLHRPLRPSAMLLGIHLQAPFQRSLELPDCVERQVPSDPFPLQPAPGSPITDEDRTSTQEGL